MKKYDLTQHGILALFFFIVGSNEVFLVDGNSFYQGLAVVFGLIFLLTLTLEFLEEQGSK
jgi:hypothetical protein